VSVGRRIEAAAQTLGLCLNPAHLAAFERYIALVLEWRGRLNLTGARTAEDAARVLVLDGLSGLSYLPTGGAIVDLGSGAGSPGLLIAVLRPEARVVLVEASRRKAAFLALAGRELGLANVDVRQARAEDLGRDPGHRGRYDGATARALAPLPVVLELVLPLLRHGGVAVLPRGRDAEAELASGEPVARLLGGAGEAPAAGLIVVRKFGETPPRFPRRPGVPARRPLSGD
jgi:16S rRNA (guanine527-N7)-methyltransferase